jgi:hypothetical protein
MTFPVLVIRPGTRVEPGRAGSTQYRIDPVSPGSRYWAGSPSTVTGVTREGEGGTLFRIEPSSYAFCYLADAGGRVGEGLFLGVDAFPYRPRESETALMILTSRCPSRSTREGRCPRLLVPCTQGWQGRWGALGGGAPKRPLVTAPHDAV